MMTPVWIVAFTGHRPGHGPGRDGASLEACRKPLQDVFKKLLEQADTAGGRIELLAGCAAGADLIAAEVAISLDIPVHVILPMPETMFEQDFQDDLASDWPRARRVIESARSGRNGHTIRIAASDHLRPDCYHEANVQMLQASDLLIAVYNGVSSENVGGTSEAIYQARCLDLPIVQVDPARDGEVVWPKEATSWPATDPIFNELKQAWEKPGEAPSTPSAEGVFEALDTEATRSGGQFRGRLMMSVYLHFLAAILAATTAAFSPVLHYAEEMYGVLAERLPQALTGLELVLVIMALVLMIQVHLRHLHNKWLRTRFATEVARGLRATAGLLDPLEPLVLHHDPRWRRFAVTMALEAHRDATDTATTLAVRIDTYLDGRVADQADRYYKKQQVRSQIWASWLGWIGKYSAISAPFFIGIAFFIKMYNPNLPEKQHLAALFAAWFPVILPLLAGSATAILVAGDHARRRERYEAMAERLEQTRCMISSLKTQGAVARLVAKTEEVLLDELIEWSAAAKNTGH